MSDLAVGEVEALRREITELREQFRTVSDLGMRLSTEMDPEALLPAIVTAARRFTRAEAGSLYVREGQALTFCVAQNDRLDHAHAGSVTPPKIELPIDGSSIAGLAAAERRTLNIADARKHPSWSARARDRFGYEVVSMLVVPLVDHRGDVSGVLQLMNAMGDDGQVVPFSERAADLSGVLASHAATAMEIARLYKELKDVFDKLVVYSARAIDARDPCTAGHSSRVARYAELLARELGGFGREELEEIRYAGMFHDIGKIGVRECVLTKADKIEPAGMALIETRFGAAVEAAFSSALREARGDDDHPVVEAAKVRARELADDLAFLRRVTHPSFLEEEDLAHLDHLRRQGYRDWTGAEVPLLTADEHEKLCVRRGNLTDGERAEIQRHTELGFDLLKKIPFPKHLQRVPHIARSHHEKMDGSGYPDGLRGEAIPRQTRIISVVDVFDALTAEDRPYKKAMSAERAVHVIERECELGAWDAEVVAVLKTLVERGRLVPSRHGGHDAQAAAFSEHDVWG